jgi:hypothetical protein
VIKLPPFLFITFNVYVNWNQTPHFKVSQEQVKKYLIFCFLNPEAQKQIIYKHADYNVII